MLLSTVKIHQVRSPTSSHRHGSSLLWTVCLGMLALLITVLPATTWATPFETGNVSVTNGGELADYYFDTIQPILGRRCTVCHGCENSPCSLKLVSYKGLERGGTQVQSRTDLAVKGFEALRLKDGPLQGSDQAWKDAWQKDRPEDQRFNPVAPDASQGGANATDSLLYKFILQGNQVNKPGFDRTSVRKLEQDRYDGGTNQCVANASEYTQWRLQNPGGGMPFGCPGLKRLSDGGYAAGEFDIMEAWILKGAQGPSAAAVANHATPKKMSTVERWEAYLNQPNNKQRLVSRFLYEHLFRAHIAFKDVPGEFYMMVRAANPPGDYPVREFVTNAPNDPPFESQPNIQFYYRLDKITDLVALKDHIVWEADDQKLARLRHLFENEAPAWKVDKLPGYESKNPFIYFQQIPPSIRYKYLLDNSKNVLENLVRSPVCNGSKATSAMDDYVWAWFIKPEADPTAQDTGAAAFSPAQWDLVNDGYRVDASYLKGVNALVKTNDKYLTELEKRQRLVRPEGLRVDDVWNGECLFDASTQRDDRNPNAWISALRHETNASVLYGGEGGQPISVYLFNFTNLERAYYSLSFNYREWGSLQHKLLTFRDFMHVRIEAEDRFLSLFPPDTRTMIRDDWSSGAVGQTGMVLFADRSMGNTDGITGIRPGDPTLKATGKSAREAFLGALDQIVARRFAAWPTGPMAMNAKTKPTKFAAKDTTREDVETVMSLVTQRSGFYNSRVPSVSYIRIVPQGWIYTMVAHRRYAAHNFVTDTLWARKGQGAYDYTSIYPGIVGDYPNIFFDVPLNRAREFFWGMAKVKDNGEWLTLRNRFMVHKNEDAFWFTVDWFHAWMAKNMPIIGGIMDVREYDNWEIPPESAKE